MAAESYELKDQERVEKKYNTRKCIVKDCPGQISKDIRFFRIPREDRDVWLKNLKTSEADLKSYHRVCSRHIEPTWIGNKRLMHGARPTLLLGHNDWQPIEKIKKPKIRCRKCSVVGCNVTSPPTRVFSFPDDKQLYEQWVQRCPIKDTSKENSKKYICKYHFHPKLVPKGRLSKYIMPIPTDGSFVNAEIKCISLQELLVETGKKGAFEADKTGTKIEPILKNGLGCPLPTAASFPNTTIWCVTPQEKLAENGKTSACDTTTNKRLKFHPDMVPKNGLRTHTIILPIGDDSEKTVTDPASPQHIPTEIRVASNTHKIKRHRLRKCRQCPTFKRRLKVNTKSLIDENLKLKREVASLRSELKLWKNGLKDPSAISFKLEDESCEKAEEKLNKNLNTNFYKNISMDLVCVKNEADGALMEQPHINRNRTKFETVLLDEIKVEDEEGI